MDENTESNTCANSEDIETLIANLRQSFERQLQEWREEHEKHNNDLISIIAKSRKDIECSKMQFAKIQSINMLKNGTEEEGNDKTDNDSMMNFCEDDEIPSTIDSTKNLD